MIIERAPQRPWGGWNSIARGKFPGFEIKSDEQFRGYEEQSPYLGVPKRNSKFDIRVEVTKSSGHAKEWRSGGIEVAARDLTKERQREGAEERGELLLLPLGKTQLCLQFFELPIFSIHPLDPLGRHLIYEQHKKQLKHFRYCEPLTP
jgi:hypothetical protein